MVKDQLQVPISFTKFSGRLIESICIGPALLRTNENVLASPILIRLWVQIASSEKALSDANGRFYGQNEDVPKSVSISKECEIVLVNNLDEAEASSGSQKYEPSKHHEGLDAAQHLLQLPDLP